MSPVLMNAAPLAISELQRTTSLPAEHQHDHPTPKPRRRVLLVAYSFPPVGGAGVQRPAKWTKYLPAAGWDVTVLTPSNPSVPVRDESLLRDIPAETTVVHAKTWEPGYAVKNLVGQSEASPSAGSASSPGKLLRRTLGGIKAAAKNVARAVLQPDSQILWVPNAIAAAAKVLRKTPHDAIQVTAPPYSSLLIGCELKRRFQLPLIADFRDEWDNSQRYLEHGLRGAWGSFVQSRLQTAILRQTDGLIATTQASLRAVQEKHPQPERLLTQCIYNGFDPDDFVVSSTSNGPGTAVPAQSRLRIVYTGTLWNLTDISPVVQALTRLAETQPRLAAQFELVCVGRKTPEQQVVLQSLSNSPVLLRLVDYCPHEAVRGWQSQADWQLLLLAAGPGAERVVPAKLFEYVATRRPILGVAPTGECNDLAARAGAAMFTPEETSRLTAWLATQAELFETTGLRPTTSACSDLAEFSRPAQARQLATFLDQVVAARRE